MSLAGSHYFYTYGSPSVLPYKLYAQKGRDRETERRLLHGEEGARISSSPHPISSPRKEDDESNPASFQQDDERSLSAVASAPALQRFT